ncbi:MULTISPECIES: hypothetical protein [Streptomyces]|uniref:CopG family transcriptional regulator n=1 Tax=Streptomyces katrae TaxID=68223 RepID=A0A0F4JFW5_9ACTN|nr:hypothetical protein [Streptomyces katrae]KJY32648.1 hypothetical protein VR44_15525 [Streptomyces katrae]
MATKKVTITLPDEVLEYIKATVDDRGVSAYVTAAVEHRVAMDKLRKLSDLLDEEYGPLTDEELRAADARLDAMDAWHEGRQEEAEEVDPLAGKAAA